MAETRRVWIEAVNARGPCGDFDGYKETAGGRIRHAAAARLLLAALFAGGGGNVVYAQAPDSMRRRGWRCAVRRSPMRLTAAGNLRSRIGPQAASCPVPCHGSLHRCAFRSRRAQRASRHLRSGVSRRKPDAGVRLYSQPTRGVRRQPVRGLEDRGSRGWKNTTGVPSIRRFAPWTAAGKKVNLIVWAVSDTVPNNATPDYVLQAPGYQSVTCQHGRTPFVSGLLPRPLQELPQDLHPGGLNRYGANPNVGYIRFGLATGRGGLVPLVCLN